MDIAIYRQDIPFEDNPHACPPMYVSYTCMHVGLHTTIILCSGRAHAASRADAPRQAEEDARIALIQAEGKAVYHTADLRWV